MSALASSTGIAPGPSAPTAAASQPIPQLSTHPGSINGSCTCTRVNWKIDVPLTTHGDGLDDDEMYFRKVPSHLIQGQGSVDRLPVRMVGPIDSVTFALQVPTASGRQWVREDLLPEHYEASEVVWPSSPSGQCLRFAYLAERGWKAFCFHCEVEIFHWEGASADKIALKEATVRFGLLPESLKISREVSYQEETSQLDKLRPEALRPPPASSP